MTTGLRYKNLTPTTASGAPSAGPKPVDPRDAIIEQAKAESLDDRTDGELITIMRTLAGSRNPVHRLTEALASDTLQNRYPTLDPIMEAWVTDGSKGSYTDTLIAALTELQTVVPETPITAAEFKELKDLGYPNRRRTDSRAKVAALTEARRLELLLDAHHHHLPEGWPDDQQSLDLRRQVFNLREPHDEIGWESQSHKAVYRADRASSTLSTTAELRLLAKDAIPAIAAAARATLARRKTTTS
ncbi:hypothetical protein [Cryobacterium sp. TMT1-66-1]|uniref:hypothetical protein n=1 Tax=Cryobacterium sp. TMT1-66-1 TaxID=1259242 RepID=UPI00106BAB04|nr:hypothetical protein [Cryobacterium sp. TMT1-66-1]TFD04141.1 hypothetical protein E3T29_15925 [Cryobacterium sp. TMT1-66-1]